MRFDDIQAPHALRAAEVALAGGHSIVFLGSFDSPADDLAELVNEQGLQAYSWRPCACGYANEENYDACRCGGEPPECPMPETDMYVEARTPHSSTPYGEPHDRVMGRIKQALFHQPQPTEGLTVQGEALLNVAARQLGLYPDKIAEIVRITKTIARLAGSDRMETAFLCEAIQYLPRRAL